MNHRFFHVSSNKKTVKEIAWDEWMKIATQDRENRNTRLTCNVSDSEVQLRKGQTVIWIPRRQLELILEITA